MSLKKKLLAIISTTVFVVAVLAQTIGYAATTDQNKFFGITSVRDRFKYESNRNEKEKLAYAMGDPKSGGENIWNIKEYSSLQDSGEGTNVPVYCLKGGLGFEGAGENLPAAKAKYDRSYNMLTEKSQIAAQNTVLSKLVNDGYYANILAILDLFYVPESSTAAEDRQALMDAAEIETDPEYSSYQLTTNDIEAMQQAALWYFTNKDDGDAYNKLNKARWVQYREPTGSSYSSFSDYHPDTGEGEEREEYMVQLYKYLINTANANASKYSNSSSIGQPITINKDSATMTLTSDKNYYEIGPFNVTKNNDLPCNLTVSVKNGGSVITSDILDSRKSPVEVSEMKKGGTFYIKVTKQSVTSDVNIDFNLSYKSTGMTLWASSTNNNEQPLVVIDKNPKNETVSASFTPENEKIFDLALRKYITEKNGTALTTDTKGPRKPSITNTDVLKGEDKANHTATYNHRKDPVEVAKDDQITYTIEVFNEGNVAGKATEITDQLPTGLEYVDGSVSGDYTFKSYDKATNVLVLQTSANNIAAYTGSGNPSSHKATIKCKVTAEAGTAKQVLTNLAWISKDEFAETGTDIDSHPTQPSTHPSAGELVNSNENKYKGDTSNPAVSGENKYWKGQEDDDDFEKVVLPGSEPEQIFDLALRKYITNKETPGETNIQQENWLGRNPKITESGVLNEDDPANHTAKYNHRKDPVEVKTGTIVTYAIEVFNEGQVAGRATKIVDQLPKGLVLVDFETGTEYSEETAEEGNFIDGPYKVESYDTETNKITLNEIKDGEGANEDIVAYPGTGEPKSTKIRLKCKVTAKAGATKQVLTNLAWIAEDSAGSLYDIDSEPTTPGVAPTAEQLVSSDENNYKGHTSNEPVSNEEHFWKGQEDDDDFEKVVIGEGEGEADLRLKKFIAMVNDEKVEDRIKSVDVSNLNTAESTETDAKIEINKEPVKVQPGDIITYTFRVYNEGYVDAYAKEITEDIPDGLEFMYDKEGRMGDELDEATDLTEEEKEAIKFNQDMLWELDKTDSKKVKTTYLAEKLISAFGENDGSKTEEDLKYEDVSIKFKVTSTDSTGAILRNEAAITKSTDSTGEDLKDRDSDTTDWKKYEDDEDYDNVVLESFDLALRKFIVAVSHDDSIDDEEYLMESDGKTYTRAPVVDASKLNETDENGNKVTTATYTLPEDPVEVTVGDYVVYMVRVYNEGDVDGYAAEIKDHLPNYLEFVEGDFNDEYGWEVSEDGRTLTTTYLKDKLISKVDENENGDKVLDYEEVPVMCKVKLEAQTDYKITNVADITKYEDSEHQPASDRDSDENNLKVPSDSEYPEYSDHQEDDDDFEKVIVRIFDLSLRKWVSEAIVTEDGVTYNVPTGHTPYDDPEEIVKVDLNRNKLQSTVVKFKYGIRVTNDGGIAGYATEITDYIPEGLTMIESENPNWVKVDENTATTDQLKDTLLQPGEYADIEILLTWINNENDLGLKTNVAEISKDYNDKGIPDVDSIPGNKKDGEDDIDDAPVILSMTTGKAITYIALGLGLLATFAGGVTLIKKYVIK